MAERKILHLDLDAFFCSVEELLDPSLAGKAFAVGGNPQGRGVIASCSYAARMCGVRSAMPAGKAIALCPGLIMVHHQHHLYGEYSDRVMAILEDTSPLVEKVSVDEAFVDVSDMPQPAGSIALDLQTRVDRETGLPCSIGVASSKLVAKIANDFGKAQIRTGRAPRQITVIPPGAESAFLAPLDIQALWGVGPKTAERLRSRGIKTIGQLTGLSLVELEAHFGKNAQEVRDRSMGIDPSPIYTGQEPKSVSNETTFHDDSDDEIFLLNTLRWLSDKVGYRLRRDNLSGSVITLKLRYSDFTTLTRQKALKQPVNTDDAIFDTVKSLLEENLMPGRPVRLLGVGVSNLQEPAVQLSLFDTSQEKKPNLYHAIDDLKDKYGRDIIQRASSLKPRKTKPE